MAFSCSCGAGRIGNLGLPACSDLLQVVSRVIIVPTYDYDGNRNAISSSDFTDGLLTDGFINGKLIESDPSKRWYITDKLFDEVEITNTDRTTQTTSSGAIYELLNGVMSFSAKLYKRPPSYSGQLHTSTCNENAVYLVDTTGRLMGEVSTDGDYLYPLELQEGSVVSEWFPKSDTSESYVSFMFQLDRVVSPENFLTIPSANINENLKKAESLIDVNLSATSGATQSTTNIFISAEYDLYGTFNAKGALEGKTGVSPVYWSVVDPSGTAITLTAVTEGDAGEYTLSGSFTNRTEPYTVSYVEARTVATAKGFESNSVEVNIP